MADKASDVSVYSQIFDSHADGVVVVTSDMHIRFWNTRMAELLNLPCRSVEGKVVSDILNFDDKTAFVDNIRNSLAGKSNSSDLIYTLQGAPDIRFQISFSPLGGDNNESRLCMLNLRFVRIQESKQQFEYLIKNTPLPIALYAQNGRGLYFNHAYANIWDVPFSTAERTFLDYNILEDEQLKDTPIMPLLERGFNGEIVELPVIPYNPAKTESLEKLGKNVLKYLKGYLFPMDERDPKGSAVVMIVQDQTDQKRAEEEFAESQLKFQLLSMGLPGVIYEYHIPYNNSEAYFNYISEGVRQLFDLSPEEVIASAQNLFQLVHPQDIQDFEESLIIAEQVDNHWIWSGRFVVNGQLKWVEAKSSPGIRKIDKIIRYGIITDITSRKTMEDAHKRTEERLRLALEAADLGFWEWDVVERSRIFNPSWAIRFGYSAENSEELFNNWELLIHPEDLPQVKQKLSKYLKKQSDLYEAEYRFMKADGSFRWVHDRGSGIAMNSAGKIVRATGTFVDIHEKRISEDRIKRQEQLFTHLFKNAPVGIVFLDEEMVVRQVNPGFCDIFGFDAAGLVGKLLDKRIVPEDLWDEGDRINADTKRGYAQKLETYRLNADNQPVPVIIYSIPVRFQNETIGIYGLYVDITDRVKVEKELEIRNLELDNFVYKVSHDLRAPLSSIMGLVNLANYERGSDTVYEYIDMIENRIKQLDNFISDILSHSKNLKLDVRYSKIEFEQIIKDCFSSLSYLPQTSSIRKVINIRGGDFYSDEWRISEILRNLISNAVKYYSSRRDDPYVEIDIRIEATYAAIYFGDNGIGITEDRLPKVFEMFYRATEHGEGSGIGLYIVKNAVERLGGVVRIKSVSNQGTSFEITLPNAMRLLDEANTA